MTMEEIRADYARRRAERQAERLQRQAELDAELARHKAGIPPTEPPSNEALVCG
jgi:hypothetical protein